MYLIHITTQLTQETRVGRMSGRDDESLIMWVNFAVGNVQRKLQSYKDGEL